MTDLTDTKRGIEHTTFMISGKPNPIELAVQLAILGFSSLYAWRKTVREQTALQDSEETRAREFFREELSVPTGANSNGRKKNSAISKGPSRPLSELAKRHLG